LEINELANVDVLGAVYLQFRASVLPKARKPGLGQAARLLLKTSNRHVDAQGDFKRCEKR
jgi:hypothetical protein